MSNARPINFYSSSEPLELHGVENCISAMRADSSLSPETSPGLIMRDKVRRTRVATCAVRELVSRYATSRPIRYFLK